MKRVRKIVIICTENVTPQYKSMDLKLESPYGKSDTIAFIETVLKEEKKDLITVR